MLSTSYPIYHDVLTLQCLNLQLMVMGGHSIFRLENLFQPYQASFFQNRINSNVFCLTRIASLYLNIIPHRSTHPIFDNSQSPSVYHLALKVQLRLRGCKASSLDETYLQLDNMGLESSHSLVLVNYLDL